ncbi:hypothetical protein [Williamsia sp. CHRR-6]|uniref:hypothetical protein n=1 Tax=Williamsia sp. CHRR-6 TaxID=2835871 RepID=UPI001BD98A81|nr:hypothetical protein [Williamsia sp. CHRR-6]MBT0568145.1 hypothetical protein [Williamsia sp. CHRR-6]
MTAGWFRRGPQSGARLPSGPEAAAREAMIRDFLELDTRLSIITEGVDAASELGTDPQLVADFASVRDTVYAAIDRYLALSAEPDSSTGAPIPRSAAEFSSCSTALRDSIATLDRFYTSHAVAVENARANQAAVPTQAVAAAAESDAALAAAQALPDELRSYSSVRAAIDHHQQVRADFDAARAAGRTAALARARDELVEATTRLTSVTAAAPSRIAEVTRALASVRTRSAAVQTRVERLPGAYSALLREFSSKCSDDLAGLDQQGARLLAAAGEHIAAAAQSLHSDPDAAAVAIAAAREALAAAEDRVDSVTDRLVRLREIRADPVAVAGKVRFQIRDAQLLAVNRGVVGQFGSVLDAASARLERAVQALEGTHPDYWGYSRELDDIADFVAGVVEKMKGGSRR